MQVFGLSFIMVALTIVLIFPFLSRKKSTKNKHKGLILTNKKLSLLLCIFRVPRNSISLCDNKCCSYTLNSTCMQRGFNWDMHLRLHASSFTHSANQQYWRHRCAGLGMGWLLRQHWLRLQILTGFCRYGRTWTYVAGKNESA